MMIIWFKLVVKSITGVNNSNIIFDARGGDMRLTKYIGEGKERKVYSMYGREIRNAEDLIDDIWNRLDGLSEKDVEYFFDKMKMEFDENVVEIVDHQYSADKLHYYQNGRAGTDTYDFIVNSAKIRKWVNKELK